MTNWEPGDLAILMTEGGERIGFRCGVERNLGWEYAREPGQKTWSSDASGYATPLRRLVVIDPENAEEVERLCANLPNSCWYGNPDDMQTALREFANPTPPRCSAALTVKGEHFQCQLDAPHEPLAHSNSYAEAVWHDPGVPA